FARRAEGYAFASDRTPARLVLPAVQSLLQGELGQLSGRRFAHARPTRCGIHGLCRAAGRHRADVQRRAAWLHSDPGQALSDRRREAARGFLAGAHRCRAAKDEGPRARHRRCRPRDWVDWFKPHTADQYAELCRCLSDPEAVQRAPPQRQGDRRRHPGQDRQDKGRLCLRAEPAAGARDPADGDLRRRVEDSPNLKTRNDKGEMVPIGSMVKISQTYGPDPVLRYNGYPAADFIGEANPAMLSSAQAMATMAELARR